MILYRFGVILTYARLLYIILHIEQGPVLEWVGLPLVVVKGIARQTRIKLMKQRHKVEREANIMPKLDGQRIRKLPRLTQSLQP
ncbi:hypothetical protein ERO13_D08G096750v2 [Gossypium hirsutum]|uniref:Uncharacterized protein n=2 Tax=Gossypium TaxID=3633 RepID=A0A5D2TVI2_GOSMU|nr:hypothetical protein ERO13_D08G096750v2 [Gossypium hirsutum]TYH57706.1 hypothetical protein ES332_D08G108500v1 [Gossypium tomentosum]TYI68685.1 hypothetical protein E1A91_D08G106400v1 [Gossypium mustelinum]KAG4133450.1 hypothetical protein ERO13_D08G096750v2 [Gossypium hirsutum]KAG4133451.1 hypothetical protein ERO13_D08G096750v2 [Gossypium hirsutum]